MSENVLKPIQTSKAFRCPCCNFKTLLGRGHFEMCPVCWWEDDGQDDHDAGQVRGGPNGNLSLRQAQENFRKFGASEESFVGKTRKPLPDEF